MGKKSRVKTQKSGTGAAASVSPKETLSLTTELLQSKSRPGPHPSSPHPTPCPTWGAPRCGPADRVLCVAECSGPAPGPGKEWEEYVQIRALVEKIRKKQKGGLRARTRGARERGRLSSAASGVWVWGPQRPAPVSAVCCELCLTRVSQGGIGHSRPQGHVVGTTWSPGWRAQCSLTGQ